MTVKYSIELLFKIMPLFHYLRDLLWRCEALNLDFVYPREKLLQGVLLYQYWEGSDGWIPGAHWPMSPHALPSSRFTQKILPQKVRWFVIK